MDLVGEYDEGRVEEEGEEEGDEKGEEVDGGRNILYKY